MADTLQGTPEVPDALVRGRFSDGHTDFTVRASGPVAPDSFQVSVTRNPADLVLIVSGINSGNLHATWGQEWRTFAPDWKVWVEDAAFKVFYTGHRIEDRRNGGDVRHCNG
ncbi:hypothetical protein [Glycomyces sp. NPDC047010]|uniref:hypothetical protein n=1 Tax=Glycomyces sp. NPDC047010 TaxID=3155023 RepID=UPI0033F8B407